MKIKYRRSLSQGVHADHEQRVSQGGIRDKLRRNTDGQDGRNLFGGHMLHK